MSALSSALQTACEGAWSQTLSSEAGLIHLKVAEPLVMTRCLPKPFLCEIRFEEKSIENGCDS